MTPAGARRGALTFSAAQALALRQASRVNAISEAIDAHRERCGERCDHVGPLMEDSLRIVEDMPRIARLLMAALAILVAHPPRIRPRPMTPAPEMPPPPRPLDRLTPLRPAGPPALARARHNHGRESIAA